MKRLSIFLIIVALIAGMVGCVPAQYNLTISSTAGGSVTVPEEGIYTYNEGEVVNLVATPDAGYRFVEWTGNVDDIAHVNAASTTITMNDDYSITANFVEQGAVYFADPNLEAAVREAINIPEGPIYPSDLNSLTDLDATGKSIFDLTGLEYATSLIRLWLPLNQISDISPLTHLTDLTELWIGDNQIDDISPLASLTSLTWLHLEENQISDISPLANLTSLTVLIIWVEPDKRYLASGQPHQPDRARFWVEPDKRYLASGQPH